MMREKLPKLFIEQKALSELDKEYEKYFDENPNLMDEVKLIEKDNKDILKAYPPEKMAALISKRLEEQEPPSLHVLSEDKKTNGKDASSSNIIRFIKSPVPLMAAAALALLIGTVPFLRNNTPVDEPAYIEGTRLKGLMPQVIVFRETGGEAKKLQERSLVREHDLLQIEYNAGDYPFGVLLSIDGRGVVTLHFPYNENDSQALERGANARLPYAYELDDAPYYERFFFLFSKDKLPVSDIIEKAEALASENKVQNADSLVDMAGVYQTSILLLKEEVK